MYEDQENVTEGDVSTELSALQAESSVQFKHKSKTNTFAFGFMVACLINMLLLTVFCSMFIPTLIADYGEASKLLTTIGLYKSHYINGDLSTAEIVDGMLLHLSDAVADKYGWYIGSEYANAMSNIMDHKYRGIGVTYQYDETVGMILNKIMDGSPAENVGLIAGDIILSIDGEPVSTNQIELMQQKLSDITVTGFTCEILRGSETLIVYVPIGIITYASAVYTEQGTTGIITLDAFTSETDKEIKEILDALPTYIDALVIDLRDNSGGSKDIVLAAINMFVSKGIILREVTKDGIVREIWSDADVLCSLPVTLLGNRNTASAAELFILGLTELGNATFYGEQTYGKATIVSIYTFKDDSTLALSTGRYVTGKGVDIEGVGVVPDVVLSEEQLDMPVADLIVQLQV